MVAVSRDRRWAAEKNRGTGSRRQRTQALIAGRPLPEIATFASEFERFDLGIEAAAHFLICCFSADGDDLGQWRAYADNGHGFALGFDTSSLEHAFTKRKGKPIRQHSTFPITYDDDELTRIQTLLVDLVDPLISLPRTTRVRGGRLHAYREKLQSTMR